MGEFRFKILKPSENQIQDLILAFLFHTRGLTAFPVRNGGYFDPKLGRFKKQASAYHRKGVPDIIVCYRGLFVGLEVKSEKGVLSRDQKQFAQDIHQSQGFYFVVRSIKDVEFALASIDQKIPVDPKS